ncbi:hypothetical protein I7G55_23320 [Sinorhizobium meliloti]|uniref:hypothetical protein n=1 Tax=Rhizobium meliloti TaxID=382 RepID=UPI0002E59572|nr:hypothetical protein [Sinorhizobium meliloti]MDE3876942.1 hypothetical protein [Sinorhizobium meliloti]
MYQQEVAILRSYLLAIGARQNAGWLAPYRASYDIDLICSDWPLWSVREEWRTYMAADDASRRDLDGSPTPP